MARFPLHISLVSRLSFLPSCHFFVLRRGLGVSISTSALDFHKRCHTEEKGEMDLRVASKGFGIFSHFLNLFFCLTNEALFLLLEGGVDDLLSCNGKEEERGKRAGEVEIREHETAACARICISAREREISIAQRYSKFCKPYL